MTDDYAPLVSKESQELGAEDIDPEEINILYVGVTRAKAAIRVCSSFEDWLSARHLFPTHFPESATRSFAFGHSATTR